MQAPGAAPTASCPGTVTDPEAARGVLCIYKDSEDNATLFVCDQDPWEGIAERDGAVLFLHSIAGGRAFSQGS